MSTQLLNGQARSEPGAVRAIDRQPTGGMDDSEVAAAFVAGDPAGLAEIAGEVGQLADDKRAELRRLIRATMAEFDQLAHEAIEPTVRHNLDEAELATVLEIRWNRAHTVTSWGARASGKGPRCAAHRGLQP